VWPGVDGPSASHERLCCLHWFLPLLVDQLMSAERYTPFAPPPLQGLRHYYGVFRPCASHRYTDACGATTCVSPLASRRQVPTFHTQA
jgi:hypothetical protein